MHRQDVRRRLEQYAANPRCGANVLSAVHDVPMDAVARHVGMTPRFGQSPFALQRGQAFERQLFDDNAARLRHALIDRKVLPANAAGFVDLRLTRQGGAMPTLDAARTALLERLHKFAAATGDARMALPTIIAGAALRVPARAILPDGLFALDVLTVHPQPRPAPILLRIGEVKVYPDRGGFTDPSQIAAARAQAGVYIHTLRVELEESKLARHFAVAEDGFLVLSRPGSNQPSVRAGEELRFQAERAANAFKALLDAARGAMPRDSDGTEVPGGRLAAVVGAPKAYADACLSFCDLADHCQREAAAQGLPSALGEDLGRFLGGVSLHRALALLRGDAPSSEAERDFLRRAR